MSFYFLYDTISLVRYMIDDSKNDFNKIDNATKIITIVISVILGSIFLGACAYMLVLINEPQTNEINNINTPQNVNLVKM